jgi:hypothetical protein
VGIVSTADRHRWPQARLDALGRLRLVESALPGVAAAEAVIDAPFERVWSYVADLERSVPEFDVLVRRVRIDSRAPAPGGGERIDLTTWATALPLPLAFDVHMEEGLCLMRASARAYFVGMAAVPEGSGTRFRHTEGVPRPGGRLVRPLARRTARSDLHHIARAVERRQR